MKKVKKLMITILAIIIALSIINPKTYAEIYTVYTEGNYKYIINNNGGVTITDYKGVEGITEITIPSQLGGKRVTSIGSYAFYYCGGLTSVTIPEGVTSIGSYAFYYCGTLTNIKIPSSVESIGTRALDGTNSLVNIEVDESNNNYIVEDKILYTRDKTRVIRCEVDKDGKVELPEGVTSIGSNAFYYCGALTSVAIPEGVTSIGSYAFYYCGALTSVTIPEGVTSIEDYTFDGCEALTSVAIPEGVTRIGSQAFYKCGALTSVTIPEGVTRIGSYAFSRCGALTSVTIPEGVTMIEGCAFAYCGALTSVTIPEGVTSIGYDPFYESQLILVTTKQEIALPEIIARTKQEGDILYTDEEVTLKNCTINEERTKLNINVLMDSGQEVSFKINGGNLKGMTVVVVNEGTIRYNNNEEFTRNNVVAKIYLAEGSRVTNNEGRDTYTFEKNGEFTFEYTTAEGENKTAKAVVNNIYEFNIEDVKIKEEKEKKYVVGIKANTTYNEFISKIETNANYAIFSKNENRVTEGNISTGMIIGTEIGEEYILVVEGDLNSDGITNIADIGVIVRLIKNKQISIAEEYKIAGDINQDSKINIADLSSMVALMKK